jgi:hypothetical protein
VSPAAPGAAFYCVADDGYFLGAVGLINSLRVLGHEEPIYVLDAGLSTGQRALIAEQATIVAAPDGAPPWLLKAVAPLAHPADVIMLLDVDLIVVRRLDELLAHAGGTDSSPGQVVAFRNNMDRFVPEWGEILELGPIERRPYLCSAAVALPRDPGIAVLELIERLRHTVDFDRTHWRENELDYPFLYADQDVLNAILSTRVAAELVLDLDHRLAPAIPFEGLSVVDERALRVADASGLDPYVIHQQLSPKPWQAPAFDGVYSRLLRRLLGGDDVALRVPPSQIPLRLRTGALAYAERRRVDLGQQIRWRLGRA